MASVNAILRDGRLTEWPVIAGIAFEVGDLLWYDPSTGGVKATGSFTWATSDSATRKLLKPYFVGVATETRTGKEVFDTTTVVSSGGVYRFTLVSATPMIGTLVGVDGNGSSLMYSTALEVVTDVRDAIGYSLKKYAAATTTVEAVLFSAHDAEGGLDGRIKSYHFGVDNVVFGTSGQFLTSFTFGQMVKIVRATAIDRATVDATTVITIRKAANNLDDTISVGSTASAPGRVTSADIADANGYDTFDADDTLGLHSDGACTTGSVDVVLDVFTLPKLT